MLFDAVQWSYLLQFSLVFGVWCMHGVLGLVHGVWFVLQLSMVHLRPGVLVQWCIGVWCMVLAWGNEFGVWFVLQSRMVHLGPGALVLQFSMVHLRPGALLYWCIGV